MELKLNAEDRKVVTVQDLATVEILGLLLSFLTSKAIIERSEFIDFARAACAQWIAEGQPPQIAAALQLQLDCLDLDSDLPSFN